MINQVESLPPRNYTQWHQRGVISHRAGGGGRFTQEGSVPTRGPLRGQTLHAPRALTLCQPLGPSACARRSWLSHGVELPPCSLLEKPRFATRGTPPGGEAPPAARKVSTALALGSQPGHTFQGPFPHFCLPQMPWACGGACQCSDPTLS